MSGTPSGAALDFQQVYDEFHVRIRRYLARLGGPGEADDLTQETFARVSQALAGVRGEAPPPPWVYRIPTKAARQAHAHQGARAAAASRLAALAVERRVDCQGSLGGVDGRLEVEQHPIPLEVLHLTPMGERDVGDQFGKALDDAQHRFGRMAHDQAGRAGDIHEERGQATSHALLLARIDDRRRSGDTHRSRRWRIADRELTIRTEDDSTPD